MADIYGGKYFTEPFVKKDKTGTGTTSNIFGALKTGMKNALGIDDPADLPTIPEPETQPVTQTTAAASPVIIDPQATQQRDNAANAAAIAQSKKGITDTANSNNAPVIVAPPASVATPGVNGIADFSKGLVDRSQVAPQNIDALIAKVNAANPMPAVLNEFDRAVVGNKNDPNNPSVKNALGTQGVYDDKVKQVTAARNAALGIIEKVVPADISAQAGIAGHNIDLQGNIITNSTNAQHYANQNTNTQEELRQKGILQGYTIEDLKAKTGLVKAQTATVPDREQIAAENKQGKIDSALAKAIAEFKPMSADPTEAATERQNFIAQTKAALGGGTYVAGKAATPESGSLWWKKPAVAATPGTVATPLTAPDQAYVNRFGSVAKAKEAWARGER